MITNKPLLFLACILMALTVTIGADAQQIQMIPVMPQDLSRSTFITQPQQAAPQQVQPGAGQMPQTREPSAEKVSDFERYISEKTIEITEFQLGILKKFDGITFQYSPKTTSPDNLAIPVKIVKITKKMEKGVVSEKEVVAKAGTGDIKELELTATPVMIDAGYLTGSRDALSTAFKILDIQLPFIISKDIKQFGYDLFRLPPSTFAPVDNVPVGPDYVIGPGDEIKIDIWGKIEGQWRVVVDRDGSISIPKAGVIGVTGLTFKELKEVLQKELSKYFSGFDMSVSLGALRSVRVYLVGNAERPGAYTVSSLSTLVTALFESGGPSKVGTMRDIQLKRNGKTIVHFDMYDFLLKGDKTKDVRVMPEDVIFIPSVGPLVGIAGNVKSPAIYELKNETTVSQLIETAGGLNDIAFAGRTQIERIVDNSRQTVFEADVAEARGMKVQSGDLVKIYQVIQDRRIIKVSGAVQREGEYGYKPGLRIKDLLSMAGGLKYYAYNKEAELTRVHVTDKGPRTEKVIVNIEKALAGDAESNLALKEDDYLFVRNVPEWQLYRTVSATGEVKFPGTYTIKKGEKLSSLIERAGGYTDSAYLRGAFFTRERVKTLQQTSFDEMIMRLEKELIVQGSVQASTAASAEELASQGAQVQQKKMFIESLKKLRATGRMSIKLAHLRLLKGSEYDIELEDGDNLLIPMKNSVVNVVGAVMSQGSFVYSENLDYRNYVEMTGGYSRFADENNTYVLKSDGSAKKLSRGFIGWNGFKSRWELSSFGEEIKDIEPGDTIVVPEKLERIAWLREIKDITQILMQVAVTSGVVLKLWE